MNVAATERTAPTAAARLTLADATDGSRVLTLAGRLDPYSIAGIYARVGEKDRAFDWLNRAYQERSFPLVSLKVDPSLDNLRLDPRFQDLLGRVGFAP